MLKAASESDVNPVRLAGTAARDSSRLRAVTTIVSRAALSTTALAVCARAPAGHAMPTSTSEMPVASGARRVTDRLSETGEGSPWSPATRYSGTVFLGTYVFSAWGTLSVG